MAAKTNTKSNPNTGKTPTTDKIAVFTGAAKDEYLGHAVTGLSEDTQGVVRLDVLANDPGSAWLYSLVQGVVAGPDQLVVQNSITLASGASLAIDNGQVALGLAGAQGGLQSLALGETAEESFSYVIRMANGALSMATATVQIQGLNDAPTLDTVGEVIIADTPEAATVLVETGQLSGHDVDNGHVLTYGVQDGVAGDDGTVSVTTACGTFTLDPTTGAYSYQTDPAALDALGAGQQQTETFTVQVTDEHGATSAPVDVVFTLVGADENEVQPPLTSDAVTFNVNPSVVNAGGHANSLKGFEWMAEHNAYVTSAFDANDKLKLINVLDTTVREADVDGDGAIDTIVTLVFAQAGQGSNGNGNGNGGGATSATESMDLVLMGFSDFSTETHIA